MPPTHPNRLRNATSAQLIPTTNKVLEPTNQDILKWTLTMEAIAPCFVRDVLSLRANDLRGFNDTDFFWLGRVPCRVVRIVGLVVGVQVYEKRIVYTVDDGTSVIDCLHRQAPPPSSPRKKGPLEPYSHYLHNDKQFPPLKCPEPIASVGTSIRIIGKVVLKHDTKQIKVDQIEVCTSSNDEPIHWKNVVSLHQSWYSGSHPFVIPSNTRHASLTATADKEVPRPCELTGVTTDRPQTPTTPTRCYTPSVSSASSPTKSTSAPRSPPRLRHPSRLHSRDLTANTFRIYLKHFMDNAPPEHTTNWTSSTKLDDGGHIKTRRLSDWPTTESTTPTKRPRRAYLSINERTPRASPQIHPPLDQTPIQARRGKDSVESAEANMQGFTVSYLRRVPELAEMARRVVKAEKQRRELEDRKRAKSKEKMKGSSDSAPKVLSQSQEPIARKMKRLFQWAIRQLYEEGSIMLWDGLVRECPNNSCYNGIVGASASMTLWKLNSSKASIGQESVISSSSLMTANAGGCHQTTSPVCDEGELSDPKSDEEAYISLTPSLLAAEVEKAIGTIMARPIEYSRRRPRPRGPRPGPTKEEILTFLKRTDERWARVGEWAVDDALELLKTEEKAWSVDKGRWELCL